VGPLLIASFAFNFNNFTVIELYNEGNPNIVGSVPPAGHTDILITYTFQVAFGTGLRNYGLASAITILIFFMVATITMINFRFTRAWEETSKNV
jgi:ABC-type sugar transport system permease subunit